MNKCKACNSPENILIGDGDILCLNHAIFYAKITRIICGDQLFKMIYTEEYIKLSES